MSKSDQQNQLETSGSKEKRRLHLREVSDQDQDDTGYGGVGSDLRAARLALSKDRREIAADLHIKRAYVQAIEEGRFEEMPAAVYAYGFVRSYAELLGLDEDLIVRRFKDEWEGSSQSTRLAFPEPPEEIRLPRGPIIAFSLLLAVAVYGGWYFMSQSDRIEVEKVPDIPERLASGLDTAAAPAPAPAAEPAPAKGEEEKVEPAEPKPDQPKAREPAPQPVVSSFAAPPVAEKTPALETKLPSFGDGLVLETREPQTYGQNNGGRVVVRAKADAWVQIQADHEGGEVFLTRILHAGDEYRVPDRNDLFLMTGNAGGLEILVDGNTVEHIGALGVVRRRVLLDPDRLITGTAIDEN